MSKLIVVRAAERVIGLALALDQLQSDTNRRDPR